MVRMTKGQSVTTIPEYSQPLRAADGSTVTLSDYIGRQAIVLFFYPRANTGGCTKEVCSFRDSYAEFQRHGALVFGASSDPVDKLAKFTKDTQAPYPLLSDEKGALRKAMGVKAFLGMIPGRETYVISKQGVVLQVFNDGLTGTSKHVPEALAALKQQ